MGYALSRGVFSLSLLFPLASIARIPQLCHQLYASLFFQQQCSFPPKELIENTNQAVWQDFVLLVDFFNFVFFPP